MQKFLILILSIINIQEIKAESKNEKLTFMEQLSRQTSIEETDSSSSQDCQTNGGGR